MSIGKKFLMGIGVTIAFFLVLEGILAIVGIEPRRFAEDPFVGFTSISPLFVEDVDADGTRVFRVSDGKRRLFNPQSFPVEKAKGTVRIFCLGGSTTFGRPFDDSTSFCGWLRELLPEVDPSHRWEVINAGGVSYASYRVALLMEELIHYDPDLFIIYSGQNEFLEARTYRDVIAMPPAVRGLSAVAARTRIFSALGGVIDRARSSGKESASVTKLGDDVITRLDASIGPDDYHRDEIQRQQIISHFRFNLARMADIAVSVDARVHLVVPASNLEHCNPFKSEHGGDLDGEALDRWNEATASAREAAAAGDIEGALKHLETARTIDPHYAAGQFAVGALLVQEGRLDQARAAFEQARDEDICPLRMLGEMGDVVREVAADRGLGLTDFEEIADLNAADGIPGQDLFLDHVHPTIEGNGLLARSILDDLIRDKVVIPTAEWNGVVFESIREQILGGVDDSDRAQALMKLSKVLGWAGKMREAFRLAQQAVALVPTDSGIQYQAGLTAQLVGRPDEAIIHYRNAITIQPDVDLPRQNLGVLLQQQGDVDGAVEQFRAALENARTEKTAQDNRANLGDALLAQGFIRYRQGQPEEAVSCFEESNRLIPGRADTFSRLGQAHLAMGQVLEAVTSLEEAARLAPSDGRILNRLAIALALANRRDESVAAWFKAIRLAPEVKDAPDALPRVLEASGRGDLARYIESAGSPTD
jgi:tetratricopeptide (TPR) repeat protein